MRILVTGGTGFVGQRVCFSLTTAGHQIRVPSRDLDAARRRIAQPATAERRVQGSGPQGASIEIVRLPESRNEWSSAVSGVDAIVNLAGESIAAGRWSEGRKQAILNSRVETTRSLVEACAAQSRRPKVLVSASAVGYYGAHGGEELDETAPPGDDFLARVCVAWEGEARRAEEQGLRVVLLRIGVVLGEGGGALSSMLPPFKLFVGGPLGSGEQWMSWIALDDLVGLIELGLTKEELRGPMNCTAPDPRTMRDFSRTLGAVLRRPSWAPVPAFVLRIVLGEMAHMLLNGQRVLPAVATRAGYRFRHSTLESALRAALGGRSRAA